MSRPLIPLETALAEARDRLVAVAPERVAPPEAIGFVTASAFRLPSAIPAAAIALRSGYAVASLDLVGASPQSPVLLTTCPPAVKAGDPMPAGTDAVIPEAAIAEEGQLLLALESPAPGAFCRLSGHDGAAGAMLVPAGTMITAHHAVLARLAGLAGIEIRRPLIRLDMPDGLAREWLAARLAALGCSIGAEKTALTLKLTEEDEPVLALQPGEAARVTGGPDETTLHLPARFEALFAAFHALALPCLAQLLGQEIRREMRPLTAKLSSPLGITEMALLGSAPGFWQPLAAGHLPLPALGRAEAILFIAPESEGFAPGDRVAAIPLAAPLASPGE